MEEGDCSNEREGAYYCHCAGPVGARLLRRLKITSDVDRVESVLNNVRQSHEFLRSCQEPDEVDFIAPSPLAMHGETDFFLSKMISPLRNLKEGRQIDYG